MGTTNADRRTKARKAVDSMTANQRLHKKNADKRAQNRKDMQLWEARIRQHDRMREQLYWQSRDENLWARAITALHSSNPDLFFSSLTKIGRRDVDRLFREHGWIVDDDKMGAERYRRVVVI